MKYVPRTKLLRAHLTLFTRDQSPWTACWKFRESALSIISHIKLKERSREKSGVFGKFLLRRSVSCDLGSVHRGTKQYESMPYRSNGLDFALYGIDIKNTEKKLDAAVRSSDYIADLIAVCSV